MIDCLGAPRPPIFTLGLGRPSPTRLNINVVMHSENLCRLFCTVHTYIMCNYEPRSRGSVNSCQDLASITQSELMRQVNDNSKNGECTLYRPATYTMIHVVTSLCT